MDDAFALLPLSGSNIRLELGEKLPGVSPMARVASNVSRYLVRPVAMLFYCLAARIATVYSEEYINTFST